MHGASRRRLLRGGSYATTLLCLLTLNFAIPRLMPGDPVASLQAASSSTFVSDAGLRADLARYYGLDRPVAEQYRSYLGGLVRGDLGRSVTFNRPAADLVRERLPWTLLLVGTSLLLAAGLGSLAGVQSGWRRREGGDGGRLALLTGAQHVPSFVLATVALLVLGGPLHWVPLGGARTPFVDLGPVALVADIAHHLVLPVSVLALGLAADHYLVMRGAMVAELGADHLVVGRAKGLSDRRLKYRYAARNALLPVVTLTGLEVGVAVTGTVFIETVFAYPGLGRLVFEAVQAHDYPVLQACFLVLTIVVVTANLAVDLLYRRLDPRIS